MPTEEFEQKQIHSFTCAHHESITIELQFMVTAAFITRRKIVRETAKATQIVLTKDKDFRLERKHTNAMSSLYFDAFAQSVTFEFRNDNK